MVPAPGRQRQSQQILPKKPSSSPPEILRGRAAEGHAGANPHIPAALQVPLGLWVLSLWGQLCLVPEECSTPGC